VVGADGKGRKKEKGEGRRRKNKKKRRRKMEISYETRRVDEQGVLRLVALPTARIPKRFILCCKGPRLNRLRNDAAREANDHTTYSPSSSWYEYRGNERYQRPIKNRASMRSCSFSTFYTFHTFLYDEITPTGAAGSVTRTRGESTLATLRYGSNTDVLES